MADIFHQVGDLLLGSIPTIVLFCLLIGAYSVLVRAPLDRVLSERRAKTEGALEQAKGAIGAAEAETSVYEDMIRGARSEIIAAREARLKTWEQDRGRTLDQVRATAQEKVEAAKRDLDAGISAARAQIDSTSHELTTRILTAILPAGVGVQEASQ